MKENGHQRTDAFELWCWRRLLRVPWTAGKSDQSNLKEISPEYSWEGLTLKLKLQYFGHLMWRTDSLEIEPDAGKGWRREEDDGGWDGWMASPTRWTWIWTGFGSWWWAGKPGMLQSMGWQRVGHYWMTKLTFFVWSFIFTEMVWCLVVCVYCPFWGWNELLFYNCRSRCVCRKSLLKKKASFSKGQTRAGVVLFLFFNLPQGGNKHFTFR